MLGTHEGLIALHIDVDVGRFATGDFVHSLGATVMRRRSHPRFPTVLAADIHDLFRVGGDEDLRQQRRRMNGFIHHSDQRFARDLTQHFPRQTRGSQAGGDDSDRFHGRSGYCRFVIALVRCIARHAAEYIRVDAPVFDRFGRRSWN